MGQFSWITQDTNDSVRESYGCSNIKLTTAYLHDDKGNLWKEKLYEGYGEFGGKDFYVLLAEMNGITDGDLRIKGIELAFSDTPHKSPNITRNREWEWIDVAPEIDPNQGWGCE